MKLIALLITMMTATVACAQTDSPYTEQEAIEEQRLSDEDRRNSMTLGEFEAYDQYINFIMLKYNDELDYEYIDDCLTYTDLVCEFE